MKDKDEDEEDDTDDEEEKLFWKKSSLILFNQHSSFNEPLLTDHTFLDF